MPRIRKSVWKLKATDKTLEWYEKAVAVMKQRPITDSTSWRYQAAIHEYRAAQDPLGQPGETLPTKAEQKKYWTQCQHGSWYFLSWHRMYLHHFEEIVAAAVASLGGPADWALPYWNYSDASDPNARRLPIAFRSPTKSDGSVNALFVEDRNDGVNDGGPVGDEGDVALVGPLGEPDFVSPPFGSGFGGPQTGFMHGGGQIGAVERVPHGAMHVAVGGWMGGFNTAALDPIFWLHHCNIDRLWEVWLRRDPNHVNPAQAWPSAVKFDFRDVDGKAVKMTSGQVVDTTAAPLSYSYDDTSDPLAAVPSIIHTPMAAAMTKKKAAKAAKAAAPKRKAPPAMVGATKAAFTLDSPVVHATFAAQPRAAAKAGARAMAAAAPGPPRRVFLNIEKLVSDAPAPSYDVYLNVPEGQDPRDNPQLFVGRLPMFGLVESTKKGATGGGGGLNYALDITHLYAHVSQLPGWDPAKLRVSFVPARGAAPAKVGVGRVSLYFE